MNALSTEEKNNILGSLARLLQETGAALLAANQKDLSCFTAADDTLLDRLRLNEDKINGLRESVLSVQAQEDPVGRVLDTHVHANGMTIENKTVPFGRILIIYESRPDVTIEASILAFKAGNQVLLKGGKEARHSNLFLVELWDRAFQENGLTNDWVSYLDIDRNATRNLIRKEHAVDLIIPRGGEGLIRFVTENASAPVIVSGRGNNFLYVDEEADFDMALAIILNGKSRLSVCNALDKVLIHEALPNLEANMSQLVDEAGKINIQVLARAPQWGAEIIPDGAMEADLLAQEFLSARLQLKLVGNLSEAVNLINRHSGGHSASIITNNAAHAHRFLHEVDCAAVYHNASTRFTDGGQFGAGAEVAISTQKLHCRGPLGMNRLVSNKWFIYGQGQTR